MKANISKFCLERNYCYAISLLTSNVHINFTGQKVHTNKREVCLKIFPSCLIQWVTIVLFFTEPFVSNLKTTVAFEKYLISFLNPKNCVLLSFPVAITKYLDKNNLCKQYLS